MIQLLLVLKDEGFGALCIFIGRAEYPVKQSPGSAQLRTFFRQVESQIHQQSLFIVSPPLVTRHLFAIRGPNAEESERGLDKVEFRQIEIEIP